MRLSLKGCKTVAGGRSVAQTTGTTCVFGGTLEGCQTDSTVISSTLSESVGKITLRVLCALGVSAVNCFCAQIHRRGAERAEVTQRQTIFPTDSSGC